jgi:hypothetical protein
VTSPGVAAWREIKPIDELFRSDAVAFWATTYNLDLTLFNEYLLRRLGDPPLNIVVLADRQHVNHTLESIPPDRLDLVTAVNRRWLLRPTHLGTGRFHPKSYLAVTSRTARLLIGSGNLSTTGLDGGREVFTSFTSGNPVGDAAINTWRLWMRRLVVHIEDVRLAERFADLEERLPPSQQLSVIVDSPLWHNLDVGVAKQLTDHIAATGTEVDELIVAAPFYDESGEALTQLAKRLAPKTLRVYVTSSTKVDGSQLAKRLDALDLTVEVLAYEPDAFTHAKLIGVTSGSRGWLLSGSANLSHAALTHSAGSGNVELAILTPLPADQLRDAFIPLDATAEPQPLTRLASLTYKGDTDSEAAPYPVTILSAVYRPNDRIQIVTDPHPVDAWHLADHEWSQPLICAGVSAETVGPLTGPLVHLTDDAGNTISNRVVVDDLDALARALTANERAVSSHPPELSAADLDSPLGQALQWMHENMVMDVAEQATPTRSLDNTEDAESTEEEDSLWTRLEQERLGRDPRRHIYPRMFGSATSHIDGSRLAELLDAMRHRAPAEPGTDHHAPPTPLHPPNPDAQPSAAPTYWSTSARIKVRARNVLRRWAAAQTDPRLLWIDPLAPLGNLQAIAAVFVQLRQSYAEAASQADFTDEELNDLWGRWLQPFIGTGHSDGWLDKSDLTPDQRARYLDEQFTANLTKLCWLAIRPGPNQRRRIIAWQTTLQIAFDKGLLIVTDDVADYVSTVLDRPTPVKAIEDDLLTCLTFIDDDLWAERIAANLDLAEVRLEATAAEQNVAVRLTVSGIDNPIYDLRIPQLIVATRHYRNTDSIVIYSEDKDWRLRVVNDEPITYLPSLNDEPADSAPLPTNAIEDLAATHGVIADLFPDLANVA